VTGTTGVVAGGDVTGGDVTTVVPHDCV